MFSSSSYVWIPRHVIKYTHNFYLVNLPYPEKDRNDYYKIGVLKNLVKIYRKPPMLESLFNKVADSQAYKFIKKWCQYQCFSTNFVNFLRALPGNYFLKESSFYPSKHLVEGNFISKFAQGIFYFSTNFHHNLSILELYTLHKKWSFPLRISSVNVTKSAGNWVFGHIYWTNPEWKTSFLCSDKKTSRLGYLPFSPGQVNRWFFCLNCFDISFTNQFCVTYLLIAFPMSVCQKTLAEGERRGISVPSPNFCSSFSLMLKLGQHTQYPY